MARAKASGRAKYSSDLNHPEMLHAVFLTSPARARKRGEHRYERGEEIQRRDGGARVSRRRDGNPMGRAPKSPSSRATTEEFARDAVRKIKVQYEVLPHMVREEDLAKAGTRVKPGGEKVTGDPDKAFQEAEVVSEGYYGIPVITHCCLEPHGSIVQWSGNDIDFWPSTQNVTGIGGDLGKALQLPAANIRAQMDYIGGGFGSKFAADRWGVEAAQLSKKSGGKPVKLYLDRATELMIAGVRPSAFAKIKVGAKKDGTITAWQSDSWATGGMGGGGMPPIPYVFTDIPNVRAESQCGVGQRRTGSRLARPQPSAGLLPHLQRLRGSGRQAQDGSDRTV